MLTELTVGTAAGAVVAEAVTEAATEAAVSTILTPEVFSGFEQTFGPLNPYIQEEVWKRIQASRADTEAALEVLEAAGMIEEGAVLEKVRDLLSGLEPPEVGKSPIPPMLFGYLGQSSRLSELAAVKLRDAALLGNQEAALAGNLEEAKVFQAAAEMLQKASQLADVTGDYTSLASYLGFWHETRPMSSKFERRMIYEIF